MGYKDMDNRELDQFLQSCGLGNEEHREPMRDHDSFEGGFSFDEHEFDMRSEDHRCGGDHSLSPIEEDCGCHEDDNEYICQQCFMQGVKAGMQRGYRKGYEYGFNKGKEVGFKAGYQKGYSDGCKASFEKGFKAGYEKGFKAGYKKGFEDGARAGYERGFQAGYEKAFRELMNCIRNIGPNGCGSCGGNNPHAPKRHC